LGALAPGGLQAILEGFDRIAHVFYFTTMSFILQGCAPWFPIAEARGLAPGTRGGFGAVSVKLYNHPI
jgi:hypothetical protein